MIKLLAYNKTNKATFYMLPSGQMFHKEPKEPAVQVTEEDFDRAMRHYPYVQTAGFLNRDVDFPGVGAMELELQSINYR